MKNPLCLLFAVLTFFGLSCCQKTSVPPPAANNAAALLPMPVASDKMNGLTMVAPPRPFPANPMVAAADVGANWISVIPYAFTRPGEAKVSYNFDANGWQWWGESPAGAKETIRLAHEAGIKTMLKPQVYVPRGWTGALDFQTDAEWAAWEADYERYILFFAAMADTTKVELFCIGTEFNNAIQKRPAYWTALIAKIKNLYHGKLVYSSNWDDWDRVPFWKDIDYIGLGGYFPLVNATTPAIDSLKTAWQPIKERLRNYSQQQQKPVIFTEFGYMSVDNCGWRNWELEQGIKERNINQQAQANCFEALFATFHPEPWWAGCFLWKWFPNGQGHEGYPERDYTPQGKLGEATVRKWYMSRK